jgi:hypothetical protein
MRSQPPRVLRRSSAACLASALVLAALLGGCAGSGAPHIHGTVVSVTEHDFGIAVPQSHLSAGAVTLRIHNAGPDQHELIVAPARANGEPLRSDGFTINEEALQGEEAGSIDPQRPGGTRYLQLRLSPGRYLLFCNMAGHFMAGMRTEVEVSG